MGLIATFALMAPAAAFAATTTANSSLLLDSTIFLAQPADPLESKATPRFGEEKSWWWSLGAGFGFGETDSSGDYNASFSLHTFLVDNVELTLEFGGWFFDQDTDDAWAGNFNLMFRWHFISRERFSVFAEAGAGMLLSTDEVPDGGSEFNFTPRAGMGLTWQFSEGPARLIAGARWQHVSNARTAGSDRNPGRDTGMIYAGLMFPF